MSALKAGVGPMMGGMYWIFFIGAVMAAWALLRLLGNERERYLQVVAMEHARSQEAK